VLYLEKEVRGVTVQAALRWSRDAYSESLQGFANGIRTADGGSHLDGLKSAVTKTVNAFAKKVRVLPRACLRGEMRLLVLAIPLRNPR
jgi:DNA gyrase subunit B